MKTSVRKIGKSAQILSITTPKHKTDPSQRQTTNLISTKSHKIISQFEEDQEPGGGQGIFFFNKSFNDRSESDKDEKYLR